MVYTVYFCIILLYLSLQTHGIARAAYNQDWSHADVRYRKSLLMIIQRSQKPAYLQGTIFIQITRGSMTDVSAFNPNPLCIYVISPLVQHVIHIVFQLLQLSYKFFALLRTMYTK